MRLACLSTSKAASLSAISVAASAAAVSTAALCLAPPCSSAVAMRSTVCLLCSILDSSCSRRVDCAASCASRSISRKLTRASSACSSAVFALPWWRAELSRCDVMRSLFASCKEDLIFSSSITISPFAPLTASFTALADASPCLPLAVLFA